jgi:hypothetical protein
MASRAFLEALKNAKANKNLESLVVGSGGRYMKKGTHEATIIGVDASQLESNRVKVTLENDAGEQHSATIFIMASNRPGELGFGFRSMLSGLFSDTSAFEMVFDELLNGNDNVFDMLIGMKARIDLKYGRGYYIEQDAAGRYVGKDREKGEVVLGPYDTVDTLKNEAKARNIYRSFEQIDRWENTNGEQNFQALQTAVAARQKAKAARSSVGTPGFVVAGSKASIV